MLILPTFQAKKTGSNLCCSQGAILLCTLMALLFFEVPASGEVRTKVFSDYCFYSLPKTQEKANSSAFVISPWVVEQRHVGTPAVFSRNIDVVVKSIGRNPDGSTNNQSKQAGTSPQETQKQSFPEKKLPVPDKAAVAKSVVEIKKVFRSAYSDKTKNGAAKRAQLLRKAALETEDSPVDKYALFQEALAAGVTARSTKDVLLIGGDLYGNFLVEEPGFRVDLIGKLTSTVGSANDAQMALQEGVALAGDLIKADEFDVATKLCSKLRQVARRYQMGFWTDILRNESRRMTQLSKEFSGCKSHLKVLKSNPDNPKSNQFVGEYYCYWKGQFEKGLPYLAKASDPNLKKLANAELAANADYSKIADRWWTISAELNHKRAGLLRHIRELYQKQFSKLTGIAKKKMEQRLTLINSKLGDNNYFAHHWKFVWPSQANYDSVKFFPDGRVTIKIEKRQGAKTYKWKETPTGLRVQSGKKRYLVFAFSASGQLVGKIFDIATGKEVDSSNGFAVRR